MFYIKKNLDRGFKDISLFEIGPVFSGNKPGEQSTVIGGIKCGKIFRHNWNANERIIDVFDSKKDLEGKILQIGKKIIKRFEK